MNLLFLLALVLADADDVKPAPAAEIDAFKRQGNVTFIGGMTKDGRLSSVVVGTAGDKLVFLVFAVAAARGDSVTNPVSAGSSPECDPTTKMIVRNTQADLRLPGGKEVRLPIRRQLVEVADGKIRFSDRRVTLEEAKAFIRSNRKSLTLQDLLQFVDDRRKKPAE